MSVDARTPDQAYVTKPNIIVPKSYPWTAAEVATRAAAAFEAGDRSGDSVAYADGAGGAAALELITAATGEADDEKFTKTAHGLSDGDGAVIAHLAGGTGLAEGEDYVIDVIDANTFYLRTAAGDIAGFSADATDVNLVIVPNNVVVLTVSSPLKEA